MEYLVVYQTAKITGTVIYSIGKITRKAIQELQKDISVNYCQGDTVIITNLIRLEAE